MQTCYATSKNSMRLLQHFEEQHGFVAKHLTLQFDLHKGEYFHRSLHYMFVLTLICGQNRNFKLKPCTSRATVHRHMIQYKLERVIVFLLCFILHILICFILGTSVFCIHKARKFQYFSFFYIFHVCCHSSAGL